jgi:hypothetical protein
MTMPTFAKLTTDEIDAFSRRRRKIDLTEYTNFVNMLSPGEWARITFTDGESQRTIKRRTTTAAKQAGRQLRYRKVAEGEVLVRVVA